MDSLDSGLASSRNVLFKDKEYKVPEVKIPFIFTTEITSSTSMRQLFFRIITVITTWRERSYI